MHGNMTEFRIERKKSKKKFLATKLHLQVSHHHAQ